MGHHQPASTDPDVDVQGSHRSRRPAIGEVTRHQMFLKCHPSRVAGDRRMLVSDDELQRLAAGEQRHPTRGNLRPPVERLPSRVNTGHPVRVLPQIAHGVEVSGFKGPIELTIHFKDGVNVALRRWGRIAGSCRWVTSHLATLGPDEQTR